MNHHESYVDSSDWIKNKKATINPINKMIINTLNTSVVFTTVALNHEETGKNLQRILKIKPFINKYSWVRINYLSGKDDWKTFDKK